MRDGLMKTISTNANIVTDFNYGKVFAIERKNDFSIIMKLVIASSFLFAVAVIIF
jgi:hypothetical protein